MFRIETSEDVKILKELTNDSRIQKLESEITTLRKENKELRQASKRLYEINRNLITADECREIVSDLIKDMPKAKKSKHFVEKPATEEFNITKEMSKKFNVILVDGNKLIHHTVRNQKMEVPVSTLELLALLELYQYRKRTLLNKDSKKICKLYNINKVQFGKLYYNLKEGRFFNAINEIDKQVKRVNFKIEDEEIKIIENGRVIDTKIDIKTYNYLLNIYINSDKPYSTIYKLSVEYFKINPIHLMTVLKRNTTISGLING